MLDLVLTLIVLIVAVATMSITDTNNKIRHINLALASEFAITVGFTSLVINLKDGAWFDVCMITINFFFCLFFIHLRGTWQAGLSASAMLFNSVSILVGGTFTESYFIGLLMIQLLQIYFATAGLYGTFNTWRSFNYWRGFHPRNYNL